MGVALIVCILIAGIMAIDIRDRNRKEHDVEMLQRGYNLCKDYTRDQVIAEFVTNGLTILPVTSNTSLVIQASVEDNNIIKKWLEQRNNAR